MTKKETSQNQDSKSSAEAAMSKAESELCNAKKTVKQLTSLVEESNLRVKAQKQKLEELKKTTQKHQGVMNAKTAEDVKYGEVMKQLEIAKEELVKLKLDIASVVEQKRSAEKEVEAFNSSKLVFSLCAERAKKEIEDLNEELVLVELATIEASKELRETEALKEKEKSEYLAKRDAIQKQIDECTDEIERLKGAESELAVTMSDIEMLRNQLELVKSMDGSSLVNGSLILEAVTEELEAAKKELESLKAESFKSMTCMNTSRNELRQILEESNCLKKNEERADLKVQNLNSKLLRAKSKLEAATAAEEKARLIASDLAPSLGRLKIETEAAKKEKLLVDEETAKVEKEIQRTEGEMNSAEQRLQKAMEELEVVKASEAATLEKLQSLIVSTIKDRDQASQTKTSITISKFEYEYLTGRAVAAKETAERKIAAAEAWVEALKASENELLLNIDIAERELKGIKETEKQMKSSIPKETIHGEFEEWSEESGTNLDAKNPQRRASRTSMTSRRGRVRISGSFQSKNRRKVVPGLGTFFGCKISKTPTAQS